MPLATSRNRLADATSPYLQQHAHNPVDWWPWCPEALERARRENRPILLSIGYSACHWCHVMAHESFEDPDTAALMNRLYINIKVDREERPDLDRIYQFAHQLLVRRPGGWPLTLFLTPDDQIPFFSGTYFPPQPRHGLPAFRDLLVQAEAAYHSQSGPIRQQNQLLLDALAGLNPNLQADVGLSEAPLAQARNQLADSFDSKDGGFGRAPKFPHWGSLDLLLRRWAASRVRGKPDAMALHMTIHTLERMLLGGINDQLGGGLCRYSVDDHWMIPHFEKMLYDNGPLLALCCDAWQATGQELFRDTALATAAWVMREMQAQEGGYYSALDADSEGEEGRFYVWTREQVRAAVGEEDYPLVAARFGLDRPPNFEGRWHLYGAATPKALAEALGLDEDSVHRRLERARERLFAARETRVRPGRDDKVLTSWNALMIHGMAVAARLLGRAEWGASAERALDFVRHALWRDGRLLAAWREGRAQLPAYLDDHAFLLAAILELLALRWRRADLEFAVDIAELMLAHFEDRERGGFFFTADDHERLLQRPKPLADESLPAGNGVAAFALARLGHLLAEPRYLEAASRTLEAASGAIAQAPSAHCTLLHAVEEWLQPPELLILRGPAEQLPAWREAAGGYAPRRLTLAIPVEAGELPPGLADKAAPAQGVAAYLCRGTQCEAPITRLEALRERLAGAQGTR